MAGFYGQRRMQSSFRYFLRIQQPLLPVYVEREPGRILGGLFSLAESAAGGLAHMFMNMILGCDWNQVFGWTYPRPALSIQKIDDEILRGQHVFQLPLDWKRDGA